ncbi:MAG: alpha-glucuronidase, partial [Erythrobacter sp.]|nr:alpha-glucuronidase [Erythrobacter sp.]
MILAAMLAAAPLHAEDGYALWLRHAPLEGEALADLRAAAPIVPVIVGGPDSPTLAIAEAELRRGLAGLQGYERPRLAGDSV